jgi:hypothetical protein
MTDLGRDSGEGPEAPLFQSMRRRRERRSLPRVVLVLFLVLLATGAVWYWFGSRTEPVPEAPLAVPEDSVPSSIEPTEALLDLPALDASDTLVRELLAQLSQHPRWAAWLVPEDLVRRFVTTVVNVAGGDSPRSQLDFLAPADSFRVRESDERTVIAPESYGRYDRLTEVFVSLDTEVAARLYRGLHPLFEEAYRELGLTARTFDGSLAMAMGNLLAVEVPGGDMEVVQYEAVYEFRDRRLEASTPAEKHLLRLGPENAGRVQQKVRELAGAVGIEPGEPPSVPPSGD